MRSALLATKWFAPPIRPDAVRRPRLVQRLDQGVRVGHVVVAAPAGFGKSTLVAQWAQATRMPVAWLSLEEDDQEPLRFLSYLVAALTTVEGETLAGVERSLRSSQPAPPEAIATDLVNALARADAPIALILDDQHLAAGDATNELLSFLLDRAPPRLHLVLTTRDEPDLPLARLRARGRLLDLRAEDLRFEPDEAGAFLAGAMDLDLDPDDVEALRATTEGWAVGLQLAALSLRGREDAPSFVRAFAGRHRHVLDYLSSEVLQGVGAEVRRFLLDVAILDRLSAPLCDAVTGRDDAAEMLERLERANLFLVPLDDERRWFRFHHLFADVLRTEAQREHAGRLPDLHRRAAAWFEAVGSSGEAIAHALAAGDEDRALRWLELAWRAMDRSFQIPAWDRWAARFPEEALRSRPVVAVAAAWSRLGRGDLAGAEAWWAEVEAWIEAHGDDAEARATHAERIADAAAYRALPARIAAGRAYAAGASGDAAAAETYARRAVELAPDDDPGARALPAGLLGLTAWAQGRMDEALTHLRLAMTAFRDVGDAAAALSFPFAIAEVLLAQGRLREAIATYEEALRYAARQPGPTLPGEAEAHIGLAEVLFERGATDEAQVELRAGEALVPAGVLTGDAARLTAARAWLAFALGDADTALTLLDEADALETPGPVPKLHPTAATRARIRLAQGRLSEARAWADDLGPPADLLPTYVDAYAHLTLVHVLLATFRSEGTLEPLETASVLLARTIAEADAGGRAGTVLEARVLEALVHQAAGDDAAARAAILDALHRAEAEGHHATFVAEGPAIAGMLRAAAREGADARQIKRLLAALGPSVDRPQVLPDLVEPLSEREGEVLRRLQSEMTGPQIARELGMSVHTFRSHTKNLYAKLGVHGRRQAVRRGRELDLI